LSVNSDFIGFNFRATIHGGAWLPEGALTVDYSAIPEPDSIVLMALGLAGIGLQRRTKFMVIIIV